MYQNEIQSEALGILQEEAAEVIQEGSKLRRTGPRFCRRGTSIDNMEHFQMEIEDFRLLLEICTKVGVYEEPTEEWKANYRTFKLDKLKRWSNLGKILDSM